MKAKLIEALPLLIGAILGVMLQYLALPFMPKLIIGLFLIVVGFFVQLSAWALMSTNPPLSVHVWQWQVLMPIGAIALATWGLAELITHLSVLVEQSGWFAIAEPCAAQETAEKRIACIEAGIDEIASGLAGAITIFVGAMFLDDLEAQEGGWWPPSQIKKAIVDGFGPDVVRRQKELDAVHADLGTPPDPSKVKIFEATAKKRHRLEHAVHKRWLSISEPSGWSYGGALARARVLNRQLPELNVLRKEYPLQ